MRARRREKGSQLVEFSLVLLPMLALIFLTIDSAWMIFAKASLQFGVREGVRYAVTSQTEPGMGQDASIRSVVQQNSFGFLNSSDALSKISITYYNPSTLAPTNSNAGGNVVQVSVNGVLVSPLAPVWRSSDPLQVSVRSADVMESSPGGIPPPR
jgi:Flp pilus assembly protein TadG